jgi:DNA-directed RNA polymerase specialized sigma subunit
MTNEELTRQFYDGDKAALHTLYEQNTGFIHNVVNYAARRYRSFIYSKDTLDDLFQIEVNEPFTAGYRFTYRYS